MWKVKGKIALLSMAICLLAISLIFTAYYGQIDQPSPLLNTNWKYWTNDPTKNITVPYLWQADLIKGPYDNVTLFQTDQSNMSALALKLTRNNQNNSGVWTTVHVRQDLRGHGLDGIYRSTISLWVFPTFHYWYGNSSKNPENTFGIEINDGQNLLWYVFSDNPSQTFQLPHHRIVLVQTPLNQWSLRTFNITDDWTAAGWAKPQSISFILILGSTWLHPGTWVGYFSSMSVNVAPLQTQHLSPTGQAAVFAGDVVAIVVLTGATIFIQKSKQVTKARSTGRAQREKRVEQKDN